MPQERRLPVFYHLNQRAILYSYCRTVRVIVVHQIEVELLAKDNAHAIDIAQFHAVVLVGLRRRFEKAQVGLEDFDGAAEAPPSRLQGVILKACAIGEVEGERRPRSRRPPLEPSLRFATLRAEQGQGGIPDFERGRESSRDEERWVHFHGLSFS